MDSSHEVDRLRIELQEKNIQVEAMMQFEHEFGLKVENLVSQKDKRICELESQLNDLSLMTPQLDERNTNLARMLRDKELEVEALESKVEAIMSEQAQRGNRSSLTESMLDFEKRVEDLRRELTGKDCEIKQLRDILDTNVPSTSSSSPEPAGTRPPLSLVGQIVTVSPRMDELNTLRSRLDSTLEELESLKLSFMDLPRELPASVLRSSEAVVNVCTEQVREYKRTAERYKRELALLKKALDDPRDSRVQALLLEDTLRQQRIIDLKMELESKKNFTCTLETGTSPVNHTTMNLECHPHILISGRPRKLVLESHETVVIAQVVTETNQAVAIPPLPAPTLPTLDGIAKRLREETQVRRQVEDENESLRSQLLQETRNRQLSLRDTQTEIESLRSQVETLTCVKSDLKSRESDMRTIRGKMLELKKEVQILELEKEEHESDKRKMQRTIDQLRQAKLQSARQDQDMRDEMEKLKKQVEQKTVKSVPVVVPKPRKALSVVSGKVVSWSAGTPKDVDVSSDLLVRLQTQLTQTEDELAACKRELLVDSKREIDIEKLKSAHLQNQLVTLTLKLEDFKQRSDHPELDLCLAVKKTETDLEMVSRESQSKDIEMIRLKSRILDLEFERTELVRRAERAVEKRDLVQAQILKLKSGESQQHLSNEAQIIERLQAELDKVSGEKKQLLVKLRECQKRETCDKVALEEAERVLHLVQETESKYLKVAKENSKLRKDLSSLNDDTFWADLETLQNDHKEATLILQKVMPMVTDQNLQSRIRKLTNSSS